MVKILNTRSFENKNKGIVVVWIYDGYNHKFMGKAICAPDDKYDFNFGEKLAYLKAKKKMVSFYKKAIERNLEETRKNTANYEERITKELSKHQVALDKIDEAMNSMIGQ